MESCPLVYVTPDYRLIAQEFAADGSNFQMGKSRALFAGRPVPFSRVDDTSRGGGIPVTRDGKRFLFPVAKKENVPELINVVTNWEAKLKK